MEKQATNEKSRSIEQFKVKFFPDLVKNESVLGGQPRGNKLGTCRANEEIDKLLGKRRPRIS